MSKKQYAVGRSHDVTGLIFGLSLFLEIRPLPRRALIGHIQIRMSCDVFLAKAGQSSQIWLTVTINAA